jgi:hypothetical protein
MIPFKGWWNPRTHRLVSNDEQITAYEAELAGNDPLYPLDHVLYQSDGKDFTYREWLELSIASLKQFATVLPARIPDEPFLYRTENKKRDGRYNVSGFSTAMEGALALYDELKGKAPNKKAALQQAAQKAGVHWQSLYSAVRTRRHRIRVETGKRGAAIRWLKKA